MKPILFTMVLLLGFSRVFAQYAYPDTVKIEKPKEIVRVESHNLTSTIWAVVRVANPALALINEGGNYQFGYTSQWGFMVGRKNQTKIFAEYTYVPARFIPHIFHLGGAMDIVAATDSSLVFDYSIGFAPGIAFFADFKDYGVSAEYAIWFEPMRYSRFFVRYRFNFWISNASIGYQDFALGLSMPF